MHTMHCLIYILLGFLVTTCVDSARILGVFHLPSKSHHILGQAIFKALASRGHHVTMISPHSMGQTVENYTEIVISEILEYREEYMQDILKPNKANKVTRMYHVIQQYKNVTQVFWSSKPVQELAKSDRKYDLIIALTGLNAFSLALGNKWGVPVILLSTIGSHLFTNKNTGNPTPFSYVPVLLNTMDETRFVDRFLNTVSGIVWELTAAFMPSEEGRMVEKYFPEAPPLRILQDNVDLVLLNSHYSVEGVRPYLPNMISVGGLHIDEPKALPEELQVFLDDAKNGAVFFSLGSNVKLSKLPQEKKDVIIKTLGRLKEKVLLKTDEDMESLPENVKIGKWFPQNDVLGHPNIKAFITHGGLLSTLEAVHHGVPIVGLPCISDQEANMVSTERAGYGIKLDILSMDEQKFYKAITDILEDERYRKNIQKKSQLFRERPMKPMDTAIFWIEHVIEHQGASHLRSPRLNLYWYQHLLFDVIALIVLIIICLLYLLYRIIKLCIKHYVRAKARKSKLP